MRIGIAGLGKMGAAMAERLMGLGHELTVWNRSPAKAAGLAAKGAAVAATPRELASAVEVIISIVRDAPAIDAVYRGPDGLLAGTVNGKLFLEMSTVRPQVEIDLAADVRNAGAALVDCPVGGTVGPAREGKLLGFAGGTATDVARAMPLLSQLCRRVDHVGPSGAGSSFKLAINLPLTVYWQALGEAYTLCRHLDMPRETIIEIFQETSGAPNVLKARGAVVARALKGEDIGPGTFDCDNMRKDLRTMLEEAAGMGRTLPVAASALQALDQASASGWGDKDCCEMPRFWSEAGGGKA
jgi:3-hydroxyisobutyrate dehydrogenase